MGSYINVEYRTSRERVDLALQIDKFIYVMELKLDGTAEEALRQISEKYHTQPPTIDSRKSLKISVDFSAKTRNIERWIVEFQYTMRKT